jgi:predicted signal transduction protein with EAL and GGDEF domain
MRQTDTVARLGGDEFAIVQSRIDHPLDASALATRLLRELSTPFEVAGHHVVISTSIGIAIAPGDGSDPDLLLKSADIALYQAKSDGRNRFRYFEPEMHTLIQVRRELELDLRKALAADEFELFFQPFFNLVQNRITGFEALLRWYHPQRGLVSPADFISVAEEMGLITQIGEWVLHKACRYAMSWPEPLKVAVNISTVQFKARNLVQTVKEALQESGLDPSRLELEITESVQQLNLLRAEGCTEIQGYLVSKPLPAREIIPMLISDFSRNGRSRTKRPTVFSHPFRKAIPQ